MASQDPPKINTTHTFYASLASQANSHVMQANPTLAAGDVKVATDDGAPANIATLPVVDADFTKRIKVVLSASEMNGDNVTIIFSDVAGAEWDDLVLNIPTAARTFDDLMYPTVSGRSLDVTTTGEAGIDWANVGSPATAVNLSATNIDPDQVVASVVAGVIVTTNNDKAGYALSAGGIQAIWDALTSTLTTVGSVGKVIADFITGNAFTRLGAPVGASISADIAGVQADTDNIQTRIPAALVSGRMDSSVGAMAADTLTAAALAADAVTEIQSGLATAAALDTVDNFIDTEVAAIKAKTDLIPAAPAAVGDVPTAIQNADALLDRNMATGTDSGSPTVRTVRQALRMLRNKWSISGTTLTVTKEDDVTASYTATLTTDAAANPVTASDPASS